jgi:uncharacterized repeat protein (TIGR03803 family)
MDMWPSDEMKTCMKTKNKFLLTALIASLGLISAGRVTAQTFTTLYSFSAVSSSYTNSDGASPRGLILSGNTVYGAAYGGGSSGNGTLFAVSTNGTGFRNLHNFTALSEPSPQGTNSGGAYPLSVLVLSGNTLYGTAELGGSSGSGTVFGLNTDGTAFTNVFNFTAATGYNSDNLIENSSGAYPYTVILSGNTLYGTAVFGGSSGNGTVFAVGTNGMGFTNLYSFTAATGNNSDGFVENSGGVYPMQGLILSGNVLYGIAEEGGTSGNGTVFAVGTNGTGFTNLHSFTALSAHYYDQGTNLDGAYPVAGLVLSGNVLYGMAGEGGSSGFGTVFSVNTDGSGFTNLHSFTATNGAFGTNSDGANPSGGLILSENTLYGTARFGGSSGSGTVFELNTDGTGFTNLHNFTALSDAYSDEGTNSDGANPSAPLLISGNTLYGTANNGGSWGEGTVFSLSLPSLSFLTNGLVAYYPFNGNANDASGNGNNGTLTNGAAIVFDAARGKSVAYFNGTNSYIDCGSAPDLQVSAAVTLAAWVKISGPGSSDYTGETGVGAIINKEGEYELVYANGELSWAFANEDPGWLGRGGHYVTNVLPTNVWQHLVLTYTNGLATTYLNGSQVDVYNGCCLIGDVYPEENSLWLGSRQQEPDFFDGYMDDVRIYNRALSSNEVAELYAYESTTPDLSFLTNGLVAYYAFNGNANDASGNGKNGVISGSGISFVGDRFGNSNSAIAFDGTGGYIELSNMSQYAPTTNNNMTVSFWAMSNLDGTVAAQYSNGIASESTFQILWNGHNWNLVGNGTSEFSPNPVFASGWSHFVVEFAGDSGTATLYQNGNFVGTGAEIYNTVSCTTPFLVGKVEGSAPVYEDFLTGVIDDVRIYNRTLSSNEVAELYAYESTTPDLSFLTNGLVAYYPFNGNANDESGNGNNGTNIDVALAPDRFGVPNSCYSFNGTNSHVDIGSSIQLGKPGDAMTISVWFVLNNILNSFNNTSALVSDYSGPDGSPTGDYSFFGEINYQDYVGVNNLVFMDRSYPPFGGATVISPAVVNDSHWHSSTVVVDGQGRILMYVDGVLSSQGTYDSSLDYTHGQFWRIGADQWNNQLWEVFNGFLDDVRIYNRAFSSNEVAELYAYESAGESTNSVLVPPRTATATAVVVDHFVVSVTITDGGFGYTNTPNVRILGGGGSGADAVAVVSNGVVTSITVTNAGFGYTNTPLVVIDPVFVPNPVLGGAPMSFLTFSNLTVSGVYQLQQSAGWYWTNQPVSFTATNSVYAQMVSGVTSSEDYRLGLNPVPSQAFAVSVLDDEFVVAATVTSGGSGYVTNPPVTIVGGGGTGAEGFSQISGGVVTNITITNAGFGYTNTPIVEIGQPPAAAVSPTVLPVLRLDSADLAPYDNYQIQFIPALGIPWSNWEGGLFTPTDVTNSQYLFMTNGPGFIRVQYVPLSP